VLCCPQLPFFVDILIPSSLIDSNFREAMISFCCSPAAEITLKNSQARKRQKRDFKTAGDQTTVCELYVDQAEDDAMDENHKKSACSNLDPCSQN